MKTKRALFIKTKHLGDSIILTSAIEALPEDYEVDVLCFRESLDIFLMQPRVREVFLVPRHLKGLKKIQAYFQIIKAMKAANYDLLAQFSDDWRGAFLARLLGVKLSVARQPKNRPAFWKNSFTQISKVTQTRRPAAEQDVDLLRKLRLYEEPIAPAYRLAVTAEDSTAVQVWLTDQQANDKSLIVVHAAARWKFKGLPNSTWAQVVDALQAKGYVVVLSGGPADFQMNQAIAVLCKQSPLITNHFKLKTSAALIKLAKVVVSIDSMSIHLASALQTPVVALFGPTDELVWAPWQVLHRVIALNEQDAPSFTCRPCGLDGCAGSKLSQCLVAMPSERIVDAAFELLAKNFHIIETNSL